MRLTSNIDIESFTHHQAKSFCLWPVMYIDKTSFVPEQRKLRPQLANFSPAENTDDRKNHESVESTPSHCWTVQSFRFVLDHFYLFTHLKFFIFRKQKRSLQFSQRTQISQQELDFWYNSV